MTFLLIWYFAGVILSLAHLAFFLDIGHIRAAIPRRIYIVAATLVTLPLAASLYVVMAFSEWLDTASPRAGWRELRENVRGQYESTLEAWHGR